MLDTQARSIYLEELKPPDGFVFDRAIATTFTLDLLSLLMIPLSLSLFEIDDKDELMKDPLLVLEALRQTAGKVTIFHHESYISIPKTQSLLYSYLEESLVPVSTLSGKGLFHPKIWALRFVSEEDVFYRVLVLSRNLTFDQSWDIIYRMEGYLQNRKLGFSQNRPLADFISSLPGLSKQEISDNQSQHVELISDEIRKVDFEMNGAITDYNFRPSGIGNYKKQKLPENFDRAMVISPFITEDGIKHLSEKGQNNILISYSLFYDHIILTCHQIRDSELRNLR